ncbi:MFS transporter [Alphaproteobacteria bacterium]|nr:MFS transporter [Alphaproteobacteria bacterium]
MVRIPKSIQEKYLGGKQAWLVWVCGALFYCYVFLLRVSPSIMTDDWMSAFGIEAATLGLISSLYFLAYVSIQLPLGAIMDYVGPRRLLGTAAFICAVGSLFIAFSHTATETILGRGLIGLGSACGFLGTMKLATLWFQKSKLGLIATITTGLGTIGAVMGGPPLSLLNSMIGWRGSMLVLAIVGLFVSALIWCFVQDEPEIISQLREKQGERPDLFAGIKEAILSPMLWRVALYGMLMYMPLSGFGDLWGVPFLQALYGVSEPVASAMNSLIFIGVVVGGPVVAVFSEKLESRRIPMGIGALGTFFCFLLIVYIPIPSWLMSMALFMTGFFFTAECLCFVVGCESLPHSMSGVAIGFNNILIMTSGLIAQPLIGSLLSHWGTASFVNNAPVYRVEDYRFALSFIPVALGLACLLVLSFRETYKKH